MAPSMGKRKNEQSTDELAALAKKTNSQTMRSSKQVNSFTLDKIVRNIIKPRSIRDVTPNLSKSRPQSANSNTLIDSQEASDWITPSKTIKINNLPGSRTAQDASTSNQFSELPDDVHEMEVLDDNMSQKSGRLSPKETSPKLTQPPSNQLPASAASERTTPKNIRPPPIIVGGTTIKKIVETSTANGINKKDFVLKQTEENNITISTQTIEVFEQMKAAIATIPDCQSYSYTPKHLRPKNLVLKGILGGYDEKDVKNELLALNLQHAKITKVTKII